MSSDFSGPAIPDPDAVVASSGTEREVGEKHLHRAAIGTQADDCPDHREDSRQNRPAPADILCELVPADKENLNTQRGEGSCRQRKECPTDSECGPHHGIFQPFGRVVEVVGQGK